MERRLTAILMADVVGYSRQMERDEVGTLAALQAHRKELIEPVIAAAVVERMTHPLPDKPSRAVPPFTNMSDDPAQRHFADGMETNILGRIADHKITRLDALMTWSYAATAE